MVVVVLVTNTEAYPCGDLTVINGVAAAGFSGKPSIPTYLIGFMPDIRCQWDDGGQPPQSEFDDIALNGGTGQAVMVQPGKTRLNNS